MSISLRGQKWRDESPELKKALKFNPPLDILLASWKKPKVVFVHTGKCAGESIVKALKACYSNKIDIYEYHYFDSNLLIRELLATQSADTLKRFTFIIANRDPLQRWISSFNWDIHNLFLSRSLLPNGGYQRFPNVQSLAQGILQDKEEAINFGKFSHMGMGISWYIPNDISDLFPIGCTSLVRQENLSGDLHGSIRLISCQHGLNAPGLEPVISRTKSDFKTLYPPGAFKSYRDLNADEIAALRLYLSSDYEVSNLLTRRYLVSR